MAERIVSPGVYTIEKDQSFLQQGVSEIGASVVGPTIKGPALIPTQVRSFAEFENIFGSYTEDSYVPFVVQDYLRNAGIVTVTRLLYEDETIQHCGIAFIKEGERYGFIHAFHGFKNEELVGLPPVLSFPLGNTGAFLMIDKNKFENAKGFNENYKVCFEDVELNLKMWLNGYLNKTSTESICYHLESATRGPSVNQDDVKNIMSRMFSLPDINKIITKIGA